MKPSIKQLSEMTGFSPATISNALNKKAGVNKETSEIIFKAAVETGYLKNTNITNIRFIIYRKNGEIIDNSPFFKELIAGVENAGRDFGYETIICHLDRQAENFDQLLDNIISDRETGNLVLATELDTEDMAPFKKALSPVEMVDGWLEDMSFNAVMTDNTDSMFQAASYLIQKGHTEIGYLKSNIQNQNYYCRHCGFLRALERAKIPNHPEYTISLPITIEGAYNEMNNYLNTQPVNLPTAFCTDNDNIAFGAGKALREHGYRIPEDVSLIGFGDDDFFKIFTPALTTVHVFEQEMGEIAVKQLVNLIQTGTKVRAKVQVCTKFVERGSVKDLLKLI